MNPPERLRAALSPSYSLERELGAGGMATVYLAEDLKHRRKVAIKVLKPELAAVLGAERFVVEIKTTAALQHPHILPLFDSGVADGFLYYVMPFIDGETLRAKLDRETQLGIDEAVKITTAVADALDYAHRHGVIHRDIKPENILLHEGRPVVADFGIALAVSAAAGGRMTETGLSLGTPHYMSPEQATAEKEITARSDVYSLASVLYEMLTGDPPHTGASAQQIIMKIVTETARPVTELRKSVPPNVAAALQQALEKLPADRFASAADFAAALADRSYTTAAITARAGGSVDGAWWKRMAGAAALVAVALGVVAAVGWMRGAPPGLVQRYYVALDQALPDFADLRLSPDGSQLLYSNAEGALMLRPSNSLAAKQIPGSEASWAPTFSPDGREITVNNGFPGALKIITIEGGSSRTLVADSTYGSGLAWSGDGWIYYLHGDSYGRDLMRIRASGGVPEFVARPDSTAGDLFYLWPQVLPGGSKLLLVVQPRDGDPRVAILDRTTGTVTAIATGLLGIYTPTGHLVILDESGALRAARFNPATGQVRGGFTTVADGIGIQASTNRSLAVSDNGTLLYQPPPLAGQVVRVPRETRREEVVDPSWQGVFSSLALSPDGTRLAIGVGRAGRTELWVRNLETGALTKLSSGGTLNYRPSWSPYGREVIFTSDQQGKITTYRVRADGSAPPAPLLRVGPSVDEAVYSADGGWIIFRGGSGGGRDILAKRTSGDSAVLPLVDSKAEEFSPTLSPDGRWLAYASDESGRTEVYVRPFPEAGSAKFTVSRNGGAEPLWSPSGRELFFRDGNGDLVAAEISPGEAFRVASSRVLFPTINYVTDNRHRSYTVTPDGRSFLFIRSPGLLGGSSQAVVTVNWFEELRRKVP